MTDRRWRERAWAELRAVAGTGRWFSSDDIVAEVGLPDNTHQPNGTNNAVGAVFRDASKAGLIRMVGATKSKQPHRKGGLVRLWAGTPETIAAYRAAIDKELS